MLVSTIAIAWGIELQREAGECLGSSFVVVAWVFGCHLRVPWIERFFTIPPQAAQMAELYWMALTRDVPFSKYGKDEATVAAAGTPTIFRMQIAE